MDIYLIGYIVIPLGLLFFIASPKRLYELLVFSIPFSGTALFQISNASFSIEGIGVAMYLGTLCMIRYVISIAANGRLSIVKEKRSLLVTVLVIAVAAIFSLIMPFIISGDLMVLDSYSKLIMYAEPKPLFFKFQYVTQVLYFVFGSLLACYFALKNDTQEKLRRTVRIYIASSLFVCLWGLLELAAFYLSLPYPAFFFNTNQNAMNANGPMLLDGVIRVISVSLEPAVLSQQLMSALPLLYWPIYYGDSQDKSRSMKLGLFLALIILLFSRSATAIFGLVSFAVIVFLATIKRRKVKWYLIVVLGAGILSIVVLTPFLLRSFLEKLTTFSGEERLKALRYGWEYFTDYPIFGIGWGVFPSWDFVVCILTGMGIIGLSLFAFLLWSIRRTFRRSAAMGNNTVLTTSIGYSFLVMLLVSQFSGFLYYTQCFWLILGLAIAAACPMASKLNNSNQ